MSIDPNFVTALKNAREEGLAEKQRKQQESCDRGAKVLQQMLVDPAYQSKVLEATRSSPDYNYCESFYHLEHHTDIMRCLQDAKHTECKRLSTLMFIHSDPSKTLLCFKSSKFSQ